MRRHEFDAVSFVAGMLAAGGAILYQLDLAEVARLDARWAAALAMVVAGVTGIATALRRRGL